MARYVLTPTPHPNVFRRQDKRLFVRVTARDPNTGKRHELTSLLPKGATVGQARTKAAELRARLLTDEAAPQIPRVADYAASWLKRQLGRGRWTADGSNTPRIVASALDLHFLPTYGDWYIDRITTAHLEAWMDEQTAAAKPNTVRSRWQWVKAMLAAAAAEFGYPDPTVSVQPPRGQWRTAPNLVLLPEQVGALVAWVEAHERAWLPLVVLGFGSGARPGELVAVKVGDLDLSREVGRWRVARHEGDQGQLVAGTKTDKAGRLVFLDPTTTARLKALTAHAFPNAWLTPSEAVLSRRSKTPWVQSGNLGHMLKRAGTAVLERKLTGKVFRQTWNTWSQLAGVQAAVTREQVGHASEAMTATYTRIPDEAREAAARMFGQMVGTAVGTRDERGT